MAHKSLPGKTTVLILLVWTLAVLSSFAWNSNNEHNEILHDVKLEAVSSYEKDVLYRMWAAGYGGVYVKTNQKPDMDPFLASTPDKNIVIDEAARLTRISPARLVKEVYKAGKEHYQNKVRIISLQPLNPENRPDEWERKALEHSIKGAMEYASVEVIDSAEYMRYFKPVIVEESCVKCHVNYAGTIGKPGGGISTSVPMAKYERRLGKAVNRFAAWHFIVWLIGMAGVIYASKSIETKREELNNAYELSSKSEKKFRALIHSASSPIIFLSAEGKILDCNNEAEKYLGLKGCNHEHSNFFEVFVEEDKRETMMEAVFEVLEGKTVRDIVGLVKIPLLEERVFTWDLSPVINDDRILSGMIVVGKDITDLWNKEQELLEHQQNLADTIAERTIELQQKNIELTSEIINKRELAEQLAESRLRLDSLVNNVPIGLFRNTLGNKGNFVMINQALAEMHGYASPEEMNDVNVADLYAKPNEREEFAQELAHSTNIKNRELLLKRNDGSVFWGSVSGEVIMDEKGDPQYFDGIIEDITNKKQAQEALDNASRVWDETFSAIEDSILIIDRKHKVIQLNKAAEKEFGLQGSHVGGKCYKVIHGADRPPATCSSCQVFLSGQPFQGEMQLESKKNRWFDFFAYPIFDSNGEVDKVVHVIRDITKRKYMEEEVRESFEYIKTITSAAQDGIIMMNSHGRIAFWNESAEKIFGYTEDEALGSSLHELLAPKEYIERFNNAFKVFNETGRGNAIGKTVELPAVRKTGEQFPMELSLSSLNVKKRWNAVGVIRDISERKKAEEELVKAMEKAQKASKAKSAFLANMSHEIRTPMNAILGFSELLGKEVTSPKNRNYLNAISSSGKTLMALINDLLDLSKIEAGKMELQKQEINIEQIINEIARVFELRAKEKAIVFKVDTKVNHCMVKIDETKLRQVLFNLLGNAVKFTSSGFVSLSAYQKDISGNTCSLVIEVEDSGIGVSAEDHERIFNAFEQQNGQSAREYGGTGLGLAISKKIIDLMGGELSLKSEKGVGSIFTITLNGIEICDDIKIAKKCNSGNSIEFVFEPARVLVVEDYDLNMELIRAYLRGTGIELIAAINGLEGLEKAKTVEPDLILMDISMPKMDGWEATSRIRKWESETGQKAGRVPILIFSASVFDDEANASPDIEGFIAKPVTHDDLLGKIAEFLPLKAQAEKTDSRPDNESTQQEVFQNDYPEISEPEKLLETIHGSLKVSYESVKDNCMIGEVEDFAEEIVTIANSHNCSALATFGSSLQQAVESFDVTEIEKVMDEFLPMCAQIEQRTKEVLVS